MEIEDDYGNVVLVIGLWPGGLARWHARAPAPADGSRREGWASVRRWDDRWGLVEWQKRIGGWQRVGSCGERAP